MLPPRRMSAKRNSVWRAVLLTALALGVAGCTPAGPRAMLRGKKELDRGDYAGAVVQFKYATDLLATNAAAWNYYGVALEHAGQADDAVNAYQRALELDRDLFEARLNLGTLFLEQNRAADAKSEFTTCTLRRPNELTGWLKLGLAQLQLGETVAAERSFSAVYHMDTNNAEVLNGFGLARIQRNRPEEAAKFFTAAVNIRPDYGAALLNLATVSQEYLRDRQTALNSYHAYLELTPRPANWDAVNAVAEALEKNPEPLAPPPPAPAPVARPVPAQVATAEPRPQPKTSAAGNPHSGQWQRPPAGTKSAAAKSASTHSAPVGPAQRVEVAPEEQIVTTPKQAAPGAEPVEATPMPAPTVKPGLWHRLFGSSNRNNSAQSEYVASGVTPLAGETLAPTLPAGEEKKAAPVVIVPPAPVDFPRYNYLSPARPPAGDRRAASGEFTRARVAEQDENWPAALAAYRQAAAYDASWFEAQYNAAVLAHRLRNYPAALTGYESALAIRPDSLDARYNFALALKAAGYVPDAAEELKKILAADPGEVRAHLALANLCAQSLHDPGQARQQYLQVLALDPHNSQTADIRFWLKANPQ